MNGWILQGATIEELAGRIRDHADNKGLMDTALLTRSVESYNSYCAAGHDPDFQREPETMGPVAQPPFYAIPLYPGGPNTKGGLRSNGRREVLDWDNRPIPRLYTAGEISSVFQFVYLAAAILPRELSSGELPEETRRLSGPGHARPRGRRPSSNGGPQRFHLFRKQSPEIDPMSEQLVNMALPADRVMDEARRVAESIAKLNPVTVDWTRKAMDDVPPHIPDWTTALEYGRAITAVIQNQIGREKFMPKKF